MGLTFHDVYLKLPGVLRHSPRCRHGTLIAHSFLSSWHVSPWEIKHMLFKQRVTENFNVFTGNSIFVNYKLYFVNIT